MSTNFLWSAQVNTGQFLSYTIFLSLSSRKPERGDIRIILANGQVREVNFQKLVPAKKIIYKSLKQIYPRKMSPKRGANSKK